MARWREKSYNMKVISVNYCIIQDPLSLKIISFRTLFILRVFNVLLLGIKLTSSTRVRMRCDEAQDLFEDLWTARTPTYHAWRTITGVEEMKWSVEKWWNGICNTRKRGKPRENSTQTPFRPRNPHGVTETRTRDPSGGRRASNRLRNGIAVVRNATPIHRHQLDAHTLYNE